MATVFESSWWVLSHPGITLQYNKFLVVSCKAQTWGRNFEMILYVYHRIALQKEEVR